MIEGENEQNDNGYRVVELCRFADLNTLLNTSTNKFMCIHGDRTLKKKLRGLSPRANYTDRAAAAGRRS